MKVLIMAGGSGTRLWPLSTPHLPKPLLRLQGGRSLLQTTVFRFLKAPFVDAIAIATNVLHAPLVRLQLEEMGAESLCKLLLEPACKNTGPAIALGVNFLQTLCSAGDQETILVVPSDHLIAPKALFLQCVERIHTTVQKGAIALFGVRPTRPETGYGYIRAGELFDETTHAIASFIEKPDRARAGQFVQDPSYYWNAGIFAFTPKLFKEELAAHCPELLRIAANPFAEACESYAAAPSIAIDYALMERSKRTVVCPLPVQWSDIGSWESVYEAMEKDQNGNVTRGDVACVGTRRCLIFGGSRRVVATGQEDLIIVETDGVTFIRKRDA